MWRSLPQEGSSLREVCIEANGTDSEIVIVPASGERVRLPIAGELDIETVGRIRVRSAAYGDSGVRTTFSGDGLELARAEVAFDGGEPEWNDMWRRARTRSLPWWRDPSTEEIDLACAMGVRIRIVAH
jgi:hypothetical protein